MRLSHAARSRSAVFDDPNLLADGGLLPVMGLADKLDIAGLVDERVRIGGAANSGANAGAKGISVLAGMVAGADSIEDLDRLRLGAMGRVNPRTPLPVAHVSALDGAQPCSQSGCPGPPDLAELRTRGAPKPFHFVMQWNGWTLRWWTTEPLRYPPRNPVPHRDLARVLPPMPPTRTNLTKDY